MKKYTVLLLVFIWLMIPLHSEITPPTEVGHTQVFNVLAQGFFEGYYTITATCQGIGDTYYLFTEDVRVNDVSISPTDPNHVIIATSSGVFVSYDAGVTWHLASGTGDNMLEPDVNNGSAANPSSHVLPIDAVFYMKEGEWWVGCEKGAYQTKDDGKGWSIKTRGLPNYYDDEGDDVFPPFYGMVWDDQVTDFDGNRDFWAYSQAGLYYWAKSKFVDMGDGLPQTLSDWDHLAVNDFIKSDSLIFIASELGLYTGILNMDDKMISWMPIGGDAITVDSSYYVDSTATITMIVTGADLNTYVNIIDESKSLYWRGRVQKSSDDLAVNINDAELYYSDETVFDKATIDYSTYDVTAVTIYQPANINISKMHLNSDGSLYYIVGTEIYKMNTDNSTELVYDTEMGINDMVVHSDMMYLASSSGLYSANVSDLTSWTKETGVLLEGSSNGDTTNYDVRTIEFDANGNMYVGCYMGGLLRKEASGTWTNLNLGIGHRGVIPSMTDNLVKAFDSLDVMATLEPWFGDIPDTDGDAKHYCLVVDMDDFYFLDAGDDNTFIDGYFNPVDQLSKTENVNSNEMDIIYIDSDPLDLLSSDAWAAVINAMTVEILQTKSVPEDEWVYRGLAELSELLFGIKDTVSAYTPSVNNSIIAIADISPTVKDYDYCFILFEYLYEHYFTDAAKMLAYVNLEETGMEGIDAALADLGAGTIQEVFNDFIAAIFFDRLTYSTIPAKYKFSNLSVEPSISSLLWGFGDTSYVPIPVLRKQTPWSYYSFRTNGYQKGYDKSPFFSRTVVFNGEDAASFDFKTVMYNSDDWIGANLIFDDYKENTLTLDDKNTGSVDVSADFGFDGAEYQELYFIVTSHETPEVSGTAFTLFDQSAPASEFSIGFNHNVGAPEYLNIFCFSDNQIYDDAGKSKIYDSDGNGLADLEGPIGELIVDTDTTELILSQFYVDAGNSDYVYSAIIDIEGVAESGSAVSISLRGENINSVSVSTTATGTLAKITGQQDQTVDVGKKTKVTFYKDAVNAPSKLAAFSSPGNLARQLRSDMETGKVLSEILYLSEDLKLNKPARISMKVRNDIEYSDDYIPILFRAKNGKLTALSQIEDISSGKVAFESDEMGSYQIMLAKKEVLTETVAILPDKFALKQNYPNPFNSSTTIRYQLPQTADVKIMIFDLMGRHVKTLYNGQQNAGFYTINWNGRSDDNRLLPSGVYFYKMASGDFQATEKMIYLK